MSYLLWFILVGLAAGSLAGRLLKGSAFGLGGDIVIGVFGAVFCGYAFHLMGISADGELLGSLIVATIGAVALLLLLRLLRSA
jgi:uncharacterized membrane protein YeaQ/YmgE (transglycosylase-associated protein family)